MKKLNKTNGTRLESHTVLKADCTCVTWYKCYHYYGPQFPYIDNILKFNNSETAYKNPQY